MARSSKNPNAVLKDINDKKITLQSADKSDANKLVKKFIEDEMISCMRQANSLLDVLYSKLYFTGSYYDGLRVKKPDEFDLDVVLDAKKLPKNTFRLVKEPMGSPGFVKFQVDDPRKHVPLNSKLFGLVNELMKLLEHDHADKYFLRADKIRSWIQGVFDKAQPSLRQFYHKHGILDVRRKQSGPALTLIIIMESNDKIDVDLVPVFAFQPQMIKPYTEIWRRIDSEEDPPFWLNGHPKSFQKSVMDALKKPFLIVPKPKENSPTEWRVDFHDAEQQLLRDKGCAKPVIKLLKLFRDCNPAIDQLFSYALKTVVMYLIRDDPLDVWPQDELADHFIMALRSLQEKLELGRIGHFFDDKLNLLESKNATQIKSMAGWLKRTLKELESTQNTERCKEVWSKYFER